MPLTGDRIGVDHEVDGRIIFAEFEVFFILHCYVPNNGSKPEAYKRREDWDKSIETWFKTVGRTATKPIIYCGDLNVAPLDEDLSHPGPLKDKMKSDDGNALTSGQAGCTPNEISRFNNLLVEANLIDALRRSFKRGDNNNDLTTTDKQTITDPLFSWRGMPSRDGNFSFYEGKGMRIDHFLCSETFFNSRVVKVGISAKGQTSKDVSFMGSDHSPVYMTIKMGDEIEVITKEKEKGGVASGGGSCDDDEEEFEITSGSSEAFYC